MKCELRNTCKQHPNMCCHFCKEKCNVRCKDNYKQCQWFDNVPVEEVDEHGNLFKYVSDGHGKFVRHYFSQEELEAKLAQQQASRFYRRKE